MTERRCRSPDGQSMNHDGRKSAWQSRKVRHWIHVPALLSRDYYSLYSESFDLNPHLPPITTMTKSWYRWMGTHPPDNPDNPDKQGIGYLYSVLDSMTEDLICEVVSFYVTITISHL